MKSRILTIALLVALSAVTAQGQSTVPFGHRSAHTLLFGANIPTKIEPYVPAIQSTRARDGVVQALDFETSEILSGLDLYDPYANQTHECNLKGYERERFREITTAEHFAGRQSIAYAVKRTRGLGPPKTNGLDWYGNGTDKIHHWIVPYDRVEDSLVEFDMPCYFGFAFKIDQRSEVPVKGNGVIIFQLWQGSPFGPPLKVHLINRRRKIHLAVSARNNITGSNPSAPWELVQEGVPLAKDQWYRCVLKTVIRHHNMAEPGAVEVWMAKGRGGLLKTASWTGPIGYDPATLGNYFRRTDVPHPKSNLVPTFGIYRERQPRAMKMYFDNVRYTTQFSLADPISVESDVPAVSSIVSNNTAFSEKSGFDTGSRIVSKR